MSADGSIRPIVDAHRCRHPFLHQHRSNTGSAFCRRYGLKTLVLAERYNTIVEAITCENQLKA